VGYDDQIAALEKGAHVVVGTPGRLLDLLDRRVLDLSQVTQLVLDEADEMLDMGFLPDVERLVEACPTEGRHTMLFSATMPTAIVKLGRRYMHHPTFTRADHEQVGTVPTVKQFFFQVHRMDKPRVLARILQDAGRQAVYVFVRTKHMADRLVNELEDLGTPAIAIHGDLRQTTRERNLDRFRSGKATVLVATEVAARGLDVDNVTHVVNYDCPDDDKMYLHRIGRTARAGRDGVAVTFAEHNESERLNVIRKAVGAEQAVVPIFSTSPELAEWFDLPAETPWSRFAADATSARVASRSGSKPADAKPSGRSSGSSGRSSGRSSGQSADQSEGKSSSQRSSGESSSGRRSQSTSKSRTNGRSTQQAEASGDADQRDGARGNQTSTRGNQTSARGNQTSSRGDQTPSNGSAPSSHDRDGDGVRSRTRTRTRQRPSDASNETSEGSSTTPSESRSSSGRTRARRGTDRSSASQSRGRSDDSAPRSNASDGTSRGDQNADGRRGQGGRKQQTSNASSSDGDRQGSSRDRDRQQETSSSDRDSRSGRSSRGRGQSSRGGGQSSRGGSQSSRGGNSGGGSGDSRATSPSRVVQAPGAEARGEGQPQVARTVKVEHLP